jgi:hypothetical protein
MKNFFGLLLFSAAWLGAQSFTFIPDHTTRTDTLNADMAYKIPIKNISATPIVVSVVRTKNAIPNDWISSMCFDESCFAPFIDSVATTPDFGSQPIPPGAMVDFSFHVFPLVTQGQGSIRLVAKNNNFLADSIVVNLTAKTNLLSTDDRLTAKDFTLRQNYPNPFNPSTTIIYELQQSTTVTLTIYDMYGQMVGQLVNSTQQTGTHKVQFDGSTLSSGVYYYELQTRETTITKKMMLVR